jgi:5-methylcytosine-specific restriction endonuclease McrA
MTRRREQKTMRKSIGKYPEDWNEIARRVKDDADWKCIRCGRPHDYPGHVLTVHHLDLNPSNNTWWNLAALCQGCHLHVQGKVVIEQFWIFEHSNWFLPYVAGYYAHLKGLREDREWVTTHYQEIFRPMEGRPG